MNVRVRIEQDLFVLLAVCALLMCTIYLCQARSLRVCLGLAYVLLFPGYTLVAALFPSKDDLQGIERVTFSFILSMALVSLMALGLHYTPWGVRLDTIVISVTSFIALTCGVAYYRRGQVPREKRFVARLELELAGWRAVARLDRILGSALALSVFFAGGTVLYFLVNPKVRERFTEFYLLGPDAQLGNYPTEVAVDESITLIVGLVNREHADVQYRVQKDVNGQEVEQIAQVRLAHGEKWEEPFTFALQEPGEGQKVSFLVYRDAQEDPYRSLHLWLTVLPDPAPLSWPTPSPTAAPRFVPPLSPPISETPDVSPSVPSRETVSPTSPLLRPRQARLPVPLKGAPST